MNGELVLREYFLFKKKIKLKLKHNINILLSFLYCFNSEQFGLYHVDFTSPERTRTPKASAKVYTNIVRTHAIDWNFRPEPTVIASRRLFDNSVNSSVVKVMSPFVVLFTITIQYSLHLFLRN